MPKAGDRWGRDRQAAGGSGGGVGQCPLIFPYVRGLLRGLAQRGVLSEHVAESAIPATARAIDGLHRARTPPNSARRDEFPIHCAIAVMTGLSRSGSDQFARLRRHLSDAQIARLIWLTALWGASDLFDDEVPAAPRPIRGSPDL